MKCVELCTSLFKNKHLIYAQKRPKHLTSAQFDYSCCNEIILTIIALILTTPRTVVLQTATLNNNSFNLLISQMKVIVFHIPIIHLHLNPQTPPLVFRSWFDNKPRRYKHGRSICLISRDLWPLVVVRSSCWGVPLLADIPLAPH